MCMRMEHIIHSKRSVNYLNTHIDTLSSNGANKTEIGRQSFGGNSKVTSRHSESRVLHLKDADHGWNTSLNLAACHL